MANSKNIGPFICLLIIIIDVIAGILGIEAEISQNKVKHLRVWIFECRDPSYQAFKLGFAAAVLLAFAHVLANMLGGCICMWSTEELDKSSANKQLAVSSLLLSWCIIFLFLLFATHTYTLIMPCPQNPIFPKPKKKFPLDLRAQFIR